MVVDGLRVDGACSLVCQGAHLISRHTQPYFRCLTKITMPCTTWRFPSRPFGCSKNIAYFFMFVSCHGVQVLLKMSHKNCALTVQRFQTLFMMCHMFQLKIALCFFLLLHRLQFVFNLTFLFFHFILFSPEISWLSQKFHYYFAKQGK